MTSMTALGSGVESLDVAGSSSPDPGDADDPLFQYIVLRRDLQEKDGWPLGSLVAQGAHAAVAAIAEHLAAGDPLTHAYVAPANLNAMHKAVLEVKNLAALEALASRLMEAGVAHKLWLEQPENVATCLATKPARKSSLQQHFKKGCSLSAWHAPKPAAAVFPAKGAPAPKEDGGASP
jgi:peptidyl-tRNA hydrolase